MYKKLNELNFVIGLFFTIVSLILLADNFFNKSSGKLNLYTGIGFLIFGLIMIIAKAKQATIRLYTTMPAYAVFKIDYTYLCRPPARMNSFRRG